MQFLCFEHKPDKSATITIFIMKALVTKQIIKLPIQPMTNELKLPQIPESSAIVNGL